MNEKPTDKMVWEARQIKVLSMNETSSGAFVYISKSLWYRPS